MCIWSYFIPYSKEYAHTTERLAGVLLACTMGLFTIGRFTSTALMRRYAPQQNHDCLWHDKCCACCWLRYCCRRGRA